MHHAQVILSSAIDLMLDQEKTFDRVHPTYLTQVVLHFDIFSAVFHSLTGLFFDMTLRLNINGFLSSDALNGRGLRQGDPISLVLFNLAFEPLLRRILQDTHVNSFAFPLSLRYLSQMILTSISQAHSLCGRCSSPLVRSVRHA